MADRTDEQPARGDDETRRESRGDESRPAFDFKLRLGTKESISALADHSTGELVQLRPIEWDPLPTIAGEAEPKSYQTDSDLQSIIVELANKIAAPLTDPVPAPQMPADQVPADRMPADPAPVATPVGAAPAPAVPPTVAPPAATAPVAPLVEATPPPAAPANPPAPPVSPLDAWRAMVPEMPSVDPTPPPVPAAAATAPAAPVPVAVEPVTVEPVLVPPVAVDPVTAVGPEPAAAAPAPWEAVAPAEPGWTPAPTTDPNVPRIYGLGDSRPVPVTPTPTPVAAAPAHPAPAPSGPVAMTPLTPIGGPATGATPMTTGPAPAPMAAVPPVAPVAAAPMPRHAPLGEVGAPLQLAKTERRAEPPRSVKAIDFQSLIGQQPMPTKRRKQRHPFRALFKLVLVLGIIGAGLYFGKTYVLDMRWSSDAKPYAEAVENQRGLDWKKAVKVETLPLADYSARLAESELGLDDTTLLTKNLEWRALGLASPTASFDMAGIGAGAVSRRPAYYDPADKKVYVVQEATGVVRDVALYRALTLALLDQHFRWSADIDTLDAGERLGLETLVEGDALATATAIVTPAALADPSYLDQQTALANRAQERAAEAPRYAVDLVAGSSAASAWFSVLDLPSDRDALITQGVASDAAVFDGTRGLASAPVTIGAADNGRGMMYWYYVLAGALPEVDAWNAALAWNGDDVVVSGSCVTATISTLDEAGRQRLLGALGQWRDAMARTDVKVAPDGTERIRVDACDPLTVETLDRATLPQPRTDVQPFGRAAAELTSLALTDVLDPQAQRCVVNAVRGFDVVPLIRQGSSEQLASVLEGIRSSCVDSAAAPAAVPPPAG